MPQLGSLPALGYVGAPRPTLANVLSARFPEIRRLISCDLNLHDRAMLSLVSHSLRTSITSQDHLKPFSQYFTGKCDVKLPMWAQCVYSIHFEHAIMVPCTNDASRSVLRLCEGPDVFEGAPCKSNRRAAVCQDCAVDVYRVADPGSWYNNVPNFGVTPICDSCPVNQINPRDMECNCTGPPRKAGQKHDRDMWLCLDCSRAYQIEKIRYADDMARAYLYMKKNKHTNVLEYLPGAEVKRPKLSTCPCGNTRFRTKCKFTDEDERGMCVWCGALKLSQFLNGRHQKVSVWDEVEESGSLTAPTVTQVLTREAITALRMQIKEKGLPPPLSEGANKYWSYTSVTAEPRILSITLRQRYERSRRRHNSDRRKLNWHDREGFLRNFDWPQTWERGPFGAVQHTVCRDFSDHRMGDPVDPWRSWAWDLRDRY